MILAIPDLGRSAIVQESNTTNNRIALKLGDDESNTLTSESFEDVRELGIDMLEVSFPTVIRESILDEFYLLIDSHQRFPTVYDLNSNQEMILESFSAHLDAVPNLLSDNIAAVKLFNFPADYDARFPAAVDSLNLSNSFLTNEPLYYQSAFAHPGYRPDDFAFISARLTMGSDSLKNSPEQVLLFEPSHDIRTSLEMLQAVFNNSLSYPESIVIIPANWFFSRMQADPSFSKIISYYLDGESVTFPLPDKKPAPLSVNWGILFLILIWGSFIIHYKYQPMYKATLPRYFFNHSFFVHDIMKNRIRSSTSAIIVIFQHTLLTGFFFYLVADAFISYTGLQSLSSHFQGFIYDGYELISIFVIGFIIALFSHIISVVWLHFFNKRLKKFYQTINLYCWPLHVNLILVTISFYLMQLSGMRTWLIVFSILYFLVWFSSYTIAAIDSAKYLNRYRSIFLLATVGIHTLLIISATILVFWLPFIYEPLEMAFLIP